MPTAFDASQALQLTAMDREQAKSWVFRHLLCACAIFVEYTGHKLISSLRSANSDAGCVNIVLLYVDQ